MKQNFKREETHRRLLDTGLSLFIQQGYHGTGVKEVVDQAQTPKGSFYTYFSSKEAFAGAVVEHFAQQGIEHLEATLCQAKTPFEGLYSFFQLNRDRFMAQNLTGGCLLGNFSNELGAQALEITPHLLKGFANLSNRLADLIKEAQREGQIRVDLPPATLADLLLNGWEGALMRAKIQRSVNPLNQFLRNYFEVLLCAA